MTELMRKDDIDKERVIKAEGRKSRYQEEVNASKAITDNKDSEPHKESDNGGAEEEDTNVALNINKHDNDCTEFQMFLNNI